MTRWPDKFRLDFRDKKAFLIEPPDGYENDCDNCGGLGLMYAFYTTRGPFVHVPPHGKDEVLRSISDPIYGWFWYAGKTFGLPCPTCNGTGSKQPVTKEMELEPA